MRYYQAAGLNRRLLLLPLAASATTPRAGYAWCRGVFFSASWVVCCGSSTNPDYYRIYHALKSALLYLCRLSVRRTAINWNCHLHYLLVIRNLKGRWRCYDCIKTSTISKFLYKVIGYYIKIMQLFHKQSGINTQHAAKLKTVERFMRWKLRAP